MYLKTLNLKGFKSFADRTVLHFEPGLSAVVGPNGSGKSNISDAVLWVLGERNAKNLRGQSMEDVIFSGSSARKPVGVAEVELVLDNSDGTLPLDYSEVSIGRRMYRSGESEYLINGSIVRRLDVLDILHDTGLGSDTNSIISQGDLDSILSSRPEDRRSLIEEAAGVLKHKERRQKSERKLAVMDRHLERVNDIVAEVQRQLKPLERKAKRAITFNQLNDEYQQYRLSLAVDDLRVLKNHWEEILERETKLEQDIELTHLKVNEAQKNLDTLQKQLASRGKEEGEINSDYRQVQTLLEKCNSLLLILRDRRSAYQQEEQRLVRTQQGSVDHESRMKQELSDLEAQLIDTKKLLKRACEAREELECIYQDRVKDRDELSNNIDVLTAEQRSLSYKQDRLQEAYVQLRDNLEDTRIQARVVDVQLSDSKARLDRMSKNRDDLTQQLEDIRTTFADRKNAEDAARKKLNSAIRSREECRSKIDEIQDKLTQVRAEIGALKELERVRNAKNPALERALKGASQSNSDANLYELFVHNFSVPRALDGALEVLLGNSLRSLLVPKQKLASLIEQLSDEQAKGEVVFIPDADDLKTDSLSREKDRIVPEKAAALNTLISADERTRAIFDVLFSQVFVFERNDDVFSWWHKHPHEATLISLDGCILYRDGRACYFSSTDEDQEKSVLDTQRKLKGALEQELHLTELLSEAKTQADKYDEQVSHEQIEALRISEELARLRGSLHNLEEQQRNTRLYDQALKEYNDLLSEQQRHQDYLEKAQPDSDNLQLQIDEVAALLLANKEKIEELNDRLNPLAQLVVEYSAKLSDARLEEARLNESVAYQERMVATRTQEINTFRQRNKSSQVRLRTIKGATQRIEVLLDIFERILRLIDQQVVRLEKRTAQSQEMSQSLHASIAQATRLNRDLQQDLDLKTSKIGEIRVEKGRLEVQVEAAIKVIIEDCQTPLETALSHPILEDRLSAQNELDRLARRLKNLGSIDPDAAQEYELVRERFEFLTDQLRDISLARKSLARIVQLIDQRMKDDFVKTFEQINTIFSEIFATFFPGGRAYLFLVDPDDLEHSGVEVNAQPFGKALKKMSLLSGGEKSMTALALLFAAYRIRETPFYILDEVEAALDPTNLRRLLAYLDGIRDKTQFIMITHQRRTMESADVLYGVSMQSDGVTKILSQKLDQALSREES